MDYLHKYYHRIFIKNYEIKKDIKNKILKIKEKHFFFLKRVNHD